VQCRTVPLSGYMDLYCICVLYVRYIYIHTHTHITILYTYICVQYIYSFLMQYNVRDSSIIFGTVHSDRTVVDLLHKISVSDGLHLMLSKHLALYLILSALS